MTRRDFAKGLFAAGLSAGGSQFLEAAAESGGRGERSLDPLAMGNHDIRAEFSKFFPGYDKTTKVPGRFVSVVETPHIDVKSRSREQGARPLFPDEDSGGGASAAVGHVRPRLGRPRNLLCALNISFQQGKQTLNAMKNKRITCAAAVWIVALAGLGRGDPTMTVWDKDGRVEFRECPKCDKRIRIDLGENKAYVNLARLEGGCREAMAAQ